jgi:hypothetical protein
MMMQQRRGRQAAVVIQAALLIAVSTALARADSLNIGASDEGTREILGSSPPTLTHGPLQLLNVLVDGRDQRSVDSDIEFNIEPITTVPHGVVIQSATLWLGTAGAQTLATPALVSVNGYLDGDGIVGLGDFVKTTTALGSTGKLTDAVPGTEHIPFRVDVTSFLQSLADEATKHFVGFHLEGPSGDSQAWVWGSAAPDSGDRPQLEVTFSAVPEPPGALLISLGTVGLSALAWWHRRWAAA